MWNFSFALWYPFCYSLKSEGKSCKDSSFGFEIIKNVLVGFHLWCAGNIYISLGWKKMEEWKCKVWQEVCIWGEEESICNIWHPWSSVLSLVILLIHYSCTDLLNVSREELLLFRYLITHATREEPLQLYWRKIFLYYFAIQCIYFEDYEIKIFFTYFKLQKYNLDITADTM